MTLDELRRARTDWDAINRSPITDAVARASLWACRWAPQFLASFEHVATLCNRPDADVDLNPMSLRPLYEAAAMAMEALKTADGGDPRTYTGWRSEENLEPWHALREARKLADDPNYVAKPLAVMIDEGTGYDD